MVKVAAIVLATVGLAILWFAATHAEVPLVEIGRAGATMNLAYVRVAGRCTRVPSYDPESDYLSFWIQDETGDLRVASYRAETRQLLEQDRVPALGDRIEVAGTLRIREDFHSLTINAPEQLEVTRPEPMERAIGTIAPEDEYQRVWVRGEVREVVEPYEGLTLITLRDKTGAIPVAVSEDLIALSGVTPTVKVGQPVAVTAAVSLYGDTPQLVPASTADIVLLDQEVPIAAERFIVELSEAETGRWVAVRGTVIQVDPFSQGVKLTLDDDTGAITLLLWQDVYDKLPDPSALGIGVEVQAQGELTEYRGDLELVPELAEDLQVLAVAMASAHTAIGEVTSTDVGQTLTLMGVLGEPESFSKGIKFPLSDDTGTIVLLLWQDVYDALPDADRLAPGARVEVTGRIDEYRGDLEIIPEADGVSVVE